MRNPGMVAGQVAETLITSRMTRHTVGEWGRTHQRRRHVALVQSSSIASPQATAVLLGACLSGLFSVASTLKPKKTHWKKSTPTTAAAFFFHADVKGVAKETQRSKRQAAQSFQFFEE